MTVREALRRGETKLREAGVEQAKADAELLLRSSLRWSRAQVLTRGDDAVTQAQFEQYATLLERRASRMPLQYVLGAQEFFGLEFQVSPAVLIPRPETELLVEAVLARLPADRPVRIADVGVGSGAIAVSLAAKLPLANFVATDISRTALEVARRNAERHGVAPRIEFVEADLLHADLPALDVVVSNPPYVADSERGSLAREVREFEPESALFAGVDGLDVYRRLVPLAFSALRPGGLLAMETGAGQSDTLRGLLACWDDVSVLPDLAGIPRVVLARRSSGS